MSQDYYAQSMKALQLAGMSERTQESYTRAVRMITDFFGKTPEMITEAEFEDYFLHRKNTDKWSPATMRICFSGIKFFFINVLKRDLHLFFYLHAKREHKLPSILSQEEDLSILSKITTFHNYVFLSTVYAVGSRFKPLVFF